MPTPVSLTPLGDPVIVGNTGAAAAQVVTTMAAVAGRTNYLMGFTVAVGIPTAAGTTTLTIAGLTGGVNIVYEIAEILTSGAVLNVTFPLPIPASAAKTAITATLAAVTNGGAGSVTLYGMLL